MKRSIKILCLLTAIILVIALFSGCSKDEKVTPRLLLQVKNLYIPGLIIR